MKLRAVLFLIVGLVIGWCTVPLVKADSSNDIKSYIGALRKIITIMEDIRTYDQQTAENTKAIREKLGAK